MYIQGSLLRSNMNFPFLNPFMDSSKTRWYSSSLTRVCLDGLRSPESDASSKYLYIDLISSVPWFSLTHRLIQKPRYDKSLKMSPEVAAVTGFRLIPP